MRPILADPFEERTARYAERMEFDVAFDRAQRALRAITPLEDEHGVPFAVGARVVTIRELWAAKASGQKMFSAGTPATIARIDERNAVVMLEGWDAPYFIRRDRMKMVLRVEGGR